MANGPFASSALAYLAAGLAPLPCGGPTKKRPLLRWERFQKTPPTETELNQWIRRYGGANIGSVTGAVSAITIIDIDESSLIDEVLDRFGPSPLIVSTPRGGWHVYYRFNDERTVTGKSYNGPEWIAGKSIDVRGAGGFIVLPPSRAGGGQWAFSRGALTKPIIENLPTIPDGLVPSPGVGLRPPSGTLLSARTQNVATRTTHQSLLPVGTRNNSIFTALKNYAIRHPFADEAEAIRVCRTLAKACAEPFEETGILSVARSVLKYQREGRLIASGEQYAVIRRDDLGRIEAAAGEDWTARALAFEILTRAQMSFGRSLDPFPISPKGLSRSLGVTPRVVARGRDVLEKAGLVRQVKSGGRGVGDVHLFVWPWVLQEQHK